MLRKGDKVIVVYDVRPLFPLRELEAVVTKVYSTGNVRIETIEKGKDGEPQYNEIFYQRSPYNAKGWQTLTWKRPTKCAVDCGDSPAPEVGTTLEFSSTTLAESKPAHSN